jgi:hypothetical protein
MVRREPLFNGSAGSDPLKQFTTNPLFQERPMSAQSVSPLAIRLIVSFVVAILGTIFLVSSPLEAQQPPEKKKEQPKGAPDSPEEWRAKQEEALAKQKEALAKIKQKLEKIDPGDDELRKLLKERSTVAIRRFDLASTRLGITVNPIIGAPRYVLFDPYRGAIVAALELLESPADQIPLVEGLVSDAKLLEDDVRSAVKSGLANPENLEEARDQRMRVEVLLIKTKRKQNPEFGDSELRKLFEEMVKCAKQEYKLIKARGNLVPDKSIWLDSLLACQRREVEYYLELRKSPEDQIPLIKESLKKAQELDKNFDDGMKQNLALPQDVQKALGNRLEVEILFAKTTRKMIPQKPEPSDEDLRLLLTKRCRCAKEQYELTRARPDIVPDKSFWLRDLLECKHLVLPYALELAQSPAEKEAAIMGVLDDVKELESYFTALADGGLAIPHDVEFARDKRLELEILLAKTKRAAKSEK